MQEVLGSIPRTALFFWVRAQQGESVSEVKCQAWPPHALKTSGTLDTHRKQAGESRKDWERVFILETCPSGLWPDSAEGSCSHQGQCLSLGVWPSGVSPPSGAGGCGVNSQSRPLFRYKHGSGSVSSGEIGPASQNPPDFRNFP